MKKILIPLFVILLTACATKPTTNPISEKTEKSSYSILQNPGIEHLKETLVLVIQDHTPEAKLPQHFFIAKAHDAHSITYMFWKEASLLWIMTPGDETQDSWWDVRYPRGSRLLDLKTDVVADGMIGSSTYLVDQSWAENIIYDAVVYGDLIIVTP